MIYLKLFWQFLQIGLFTFGGGYAMIAFIWEKALAYGWLTEEELLNMIAVSESTPGPIAVNMATFVGSSQGGALGAVVATLGVVLPSFLPGDSVDCGCASKRDEAGRCASVFGKRATMCDCADSLHGDHLAVERSVWHPNGWGSCSSRFQRDLDSWAGCRLGICAEEAAREGVLSHSADSDFRRAWHDFIFDLIFFVQKGECV